WESDRAQPEAGGGCERRVDGGAPHEHAEAIVTAEGAELHEQVVDVAADATAAVGLGEVQELSVQPDVQRYSPPPGPAWLHARGRPGRSVPEAASQQPAAPCPPYPAPVQSSRRTSPALARKA